jgi:hypothetical protein
MFCAVQLETEVVSTFCMLICYMPAYCANTGRSARDLIIMLCRCEGAIKTPAITWSPPISLHSSSMSDRYGLRIQPVNATQ